jgi:hypothetical protein
LQLPVRTVLLKNTVLVLQLPVRTVLLKNTVLTAWCRSDRDPILLGFPKKISGFMTALAR